jgi:hypothetical protein
LKSKVEKLNSSIHIGEVIINCSDKVKKVELVEMGRVKDNSSNHIKGVSKKSSDRLSKRFTITLMEILACPM